MSLVLLNKTNNIATLTLNAPDQLNAMSVAMGEEFGKRLEQIKNDPEIRAVILTGAGRAFSSGGNLDMLTEKLERNQSQNEENLKAFYKMFLEVRNIPQPVIAAINGHAIGAGFCLALACDLRYASSKAKMGANFAKIALAPGMGGTYLITRLAGPVNAAEILLTGRTFDANHAKEYGLLNAVCEPDDLIQHVQAVAEEIAKNGPIALKYIKKGIQEAQDKTLEQMFDYDSQSQAACFETEDIKEGIAAVRDKRPPKFQGK